jgi:hypothetical protein
MVVPMWSDITDVSVLRGAGSWCEEGGSGVWAWEEVEMSVIKFLLN